MDEKKKLIADFEKIGWGGPDPAHVVHMCIYNYSDKCRKNSCGFYFFDPLRTCPTFFIITLVG